VEEADVKCRPPYLWLSAGNFLEVIQTVVDLAGGKDMSAVVAALGRNAQRGVGEVTFSLDQYLSSHTAN
jgi:hypothetical protein